MYDASAPPSMEKLVALALRKVTTASDALITDDVISSDVTSSEEPHDVTSRLKLITVKIELRFVAITKYLNS